MQLLTVSAVSLPILYSLSRGLRFPRLSLEPKQALSKIQKGELTVSMTDAIQLRPDQESLSFRAYAPEPQLEITSNSAQEVEFEVHNVPDQAVLSSDSVDYSEQKNGLTRKILLSLKPKQTTHLYWAFPNQQQFSFAAIGDTGGDQELAWCIDRAHQLGADFLLHLGDFNYQQEDYENAIKLFNAAKIPVYVSIGNHDFHEDGLIYEKFLQQIGPLNHTFQIGSTRFINFDTAANFIPYGSGSRGELFDQLIKSAEQEKTQITNTIAFTHRPLFDPIENQDHTIGSEGERQWLISRLKALKVTTLICGHIHIFDRKNVNGIDNIIVGQGLGHQDLLTNSDVSKMALLTVDAKELNISFKNLAMPMSMHCHPRSDEVKQSIRNSAHSDNLKTIDAACKKG